jgi:hypothetical protein
MPSRLDIAPFFEPEPPLPHAVILGDIRRGSVPQPWAEPSGSGDNLKKRGNPPSAQELISQIRA